MAPIEFLNLNHYFEENQEAYLSTFKKIMTRGHFILGEEVLQFEKEFANYISCRHVLGTGNGLDAITLALKALNIGPGDEVIVPAHTFIATWLPVSYVGATLRPVDVDPITMNLSTEFAKSSISSRTKAIIGVHLYGRPCDAPGLRKLCDENNLFFIEDAAQAHGAAIKDQKIGSIGHVSTFSFYPGKNLGAYGDGGAVCTQDDNLARKLKMLRNYGSELKYHHDLIGVNSRLDEFLAAFLRLRLKTLDTENKKRQSLAYLYNEILGVSAQINRPSMEIEGKQVWHMYVIRTKQRDELQKYLLQKNIPTLIHYPIPCHLSKCYQSLGFKKGDFPVTEEISNSAISLPIGPHLSEEQVFYIAKSVNSFFE